MAHLRQFLPLLLVLPLVGCFADQKAQLAKCEYAAPRTGAGEPFKSVRDCMDQAGYRFIGWDDGITCGLGAVVKARALADGTDALCFEPKGWLALKIYRIEVPTRKSRAT
ncbi:MAG TPA: hypothetical protein VN723_07835 [Rhizomicrobium sp.]|jgi:hypothetical protein|nr:hypothetical protein [Rhizomicrobium sp.]